jgi:omega-6 fatty acid desaturase (delta-12 desaturase)
MATETAKSNTKAEKPHALLSPYVRRSALKGLTLFHIDAAIYLISAYGAIFCNHILLKLSCSLLMGLFTALLFTIGHDACHNSLTPSRTLNKIIGRIAFLPSLHAFSLWDLGHNKTHHRYTNLKGYDYVFVPLSKSEYDSLPTRRRVLERYYRSIWGQWLYYFHQIWWKKMFFPSKREVANRKSIYISDSLLVCVWAIFLISITQLTGSGRLPGYERGQWFLSFTFLILIPQFVWNCLMTFAIYQHHTHPCVAWYANHEEWLSSRVESRSSTHVILPKWISLLLHNIMEHTAHHVHMQVPLYELTVAQAVIERALVTDVMIQKWTLGVYLENIRKCKLYDYDNHRWVGFDGKPTSKPIRQTLNARLSKSTRCTSTTSYVQPGPIDSRVLS